MRAVLRIALSLALWSASLAPLPWLGQRAAHAAVPWMINYQGRLTDTASQAVTGTLTMTFRLYDASTAGTELWEEQQTVTLAEADSGIFSVVLGAVEGLSSVNFNNPIWLSVQVADDSEMTPRQRLTAVGYAMNADMVDGLDSTKFVRTDIDSSSSGKLTLTTSGTALLIKPSTDPAANTAMLDIQNAAGTSKFNVDLEGDTTIAGNLAVTGTISGTTAISGTTSTTWTVDSDATGTEPASGAGLVIEGGSGDVSLTWNAASDHLALDKDFSLSAQKALRFADSDSSNYMAFKAPATVGSNITWTLPSADATASGQVLSSDASGTLSWVSAGSIPGAGDITSVTAGAGLTGGGTSGDVTLTIGAGTGITVNADDIAATLGTDISASEIANADHGAFTYTAGVAALDTDSVGAAQISAGAVGVSEIGTDAVSTDEIAANGVGSDEIATGAVGSDEIAVSGVTAATYGSATQVPAIAVDEDGRITSATNTTISVTGSNIQNDSLDFAQFDDTLDLDAATEINLGATNLTVDLDSTGDFVVADAGVGTHIFKDDGTVGIGTTSPAQKLTVADGTLLQTVTASFTPSSLGGITVDGGVGAIAVGGRYAYMANNETNALTVVDLTVPGTPVAVGSYVHNGNIDQIRLAGKYAYITVSGSGAQEFRIVDISNPASPALVGGIQWDANPNGLDVAGKYAYLGTDVDGTNYLRIIDVSNPASPVQVGALSLTVPVGALDVQGKYAYIGVDAAGAGAGFRVISVSDPTNPTAVGSVAGSGGGNTYTDIQVSGQYAYTGMDATGNDFRVFDVSDPTAPTLAGGVELGGAVSAVRLAGKYAYVALSGSSGVDLRILDVSNPASPSAVGGVELGSSADGLDLAGKYAYVGHGAASNNFLVLDAAGLDTPAASIGVLATNSLQVSEHARVGGALSADAINVGVGGILSAGPVAVTDGAMLDLSKINASSTTEGLTLPQTTACTSATAEGQVCWDTDNENLYVGTASGAQLVGGGSSATGTITGVTAGAGLTGGGASGAVTLTVGAGTGITVNADDIAATLGVSIAANEMADADHGDISWSSGVASVEDDSHAHTTTTISGLDISDDTNLAAGTDGVDLNGDTLEFDATEVGTETWGAADGTWTFDSTAGTNPMLGWTDSQFNLTGALDASGHLAVGGSASVATTELARISETFTTDAANYGLRLTPTYDLSSGDFSSTSYGLSVEPSTDADWELATVGLTGIQSKLTTTSTSAQSWAPLLAIGMDVSKSYGASAVPATSYGLRIQDMGAAGGTSAYGLYLAPQTGSTNVYGLCFDCDGTWSASTVASGIQFGTDANAVTLYRSASDTLKTDDSFAVAGSALTISAGALTDASVVEDDLAASLAFDDGDLLNLSGINTSGTSEGLILPQTTSCASGTAEGQICWDSDNDILYVGANGSVATVGGTGTSAFTASSGVVGQTTSTDRLRLRAGEATDLGLEIEGHASQSVNLLQIDANTTDAQPLVAVDSTGKLQFGAGGSTAVDTNLYRSAANTLATDDSLTFTGDPIITFGDATAKGYLRTWDIGGFGQHVAMMSDMNIYWGIDENADQNGSSYNWMHNGIANSAYLMTLSDAGQLMLPITTGATAGLLMGGDANLYRSAADTLATDDALNVLGILSAGSTSHKSAFSASGVLTYVGNARPRRSVVLTPAGAILASGGASQTLNGTNFKYYTVDFADGSQKDAYWQFTVPDSADSSSSTVDVTFYWTTTATTGNCRWQVAMDGKASGAAFDAALQSASASNFAAQGTASYLAASTISSVTSGWAPGEIATIKVSRRGDDSGNDTLTATAKLVMVKIEWLANAESD